MRHATRLKHAAIGFSSDSAIVYFIPPLGRAFDHGGSHGNHCSLPKMSNNCGSNSSRTSSNQELRNRLVEMYLPLVKYNGERIWARLPEGVELDDLISAGVFGLMDAIDAFDLSRGVKFETYCVPRIRGAMLDELRTMDWVPRLVRSKASKLNEAVKNARSPARPPAQRERTGRRRCRSPCPSWKR